MVIYAIFICFIGIPAYAAPCQDHPAWGPFDTLVNCQHYKFTVEHSNGGSPELLAEKGVKYVCMKETVPG
jgi:hypothetical protein